MQAAYAGMSIPADALPIAKTLADEVLSLPIGPHLTKADAQCVIAALHAAG
ncbi:MAG: DegT/DnrJ/EryC1/StrS family aminotransferase [Roseovarius sp.]